MFTRQRGTPGGSATAAEPRSLLRRYCLSLFSLSCSPSLTLSLSHTHTLSLSDHEIEWLVSHERGGLGFGEEIVRDHQIRARLHRQV